jgi:hypothetical protein
MRTKAIVRRPDKNFAKGITASVLGKPDFENTPCSTLLQANYRLEIDI